MKKFILSLFIFFIFSNTYANTYIEQSIFNHKIKAIGYNLSSQIYNLKVIIADTQTPLKTLLEKNNTITGINGVFFCPSDYSWCETKNGYTKNERYIKGKKIGNSYHTEDRVVFAWDKNNNPFLFKNTNINNDKENEIYYGLGNHPLLLKDGENALDYYVKNNLIYDNMKIPGIRTFICSNKEKSNIYFGIINDATIYEVPEILSIFGCYDALNLDAGLSTDFVYNNKNLIKPGRPILDGIGIEIKDTNLKTIKKNSLKIILKLIEKEIIKNDKKALKQKIQNLKNQIKIKQTNIQNQYKKEITRKNIVGFEDIVGFEINIDNKKTITEIIILNYIEEYLDIINNFLK